MTLKRGMILSAGLGKRLLPITEKIPKPLIPVLNIPNILYSINSLKKAGIKKIIINLFHLGNLIKEFLGNGEKFDVEIHYSEEKILLGTGGGLKKAEKFFENEPFILINCDFITNFDFILAINEHFKHDSLATMILYSNSSLESQYSSVGIDEKNNICSLPKLTTKIPYKSGIFTGIHILNPTVLKYLEERPMGINEVLYPYLMKEEPSKVFGFFMNNTFWYDTGETYFYWLTSMRLLHELKNEEFLKDFNILASYEKTGPNIWGNIEHLPNDCTLKGPLVIGKNVKIGNGIIIGPNVIIGNNTVISSEVEISNSIIFNNSVINTKKLYKAIFFERPLPLS